MALGGEQITPGGWGTASTGSCPMIPGFGPTGFSMAVSCGIGEEADTGGSRKEGKGGREGGRGE